nr:RagB/SusD family nutrient uptake outer membrane protein [uncultured Sphingobacterium sp.]
MKKNLLIIGLLVGVLMTSSCNKYLDIQPVGTVIPKSESDFRALMVSAYISYPAHKSRLNLRTDELILDESSTDIASIKDLYLWNDQNPDATTFPMAWETIYKSIFYANYVIAEGKNVAGDSEAMQQIRAEAYLIRAYSHFELLNTYSESYNPATAAMDRGVPISIKVDLEQLFEPASVEQVYTQILGDMKEAEALLHVIDNASDVKYRFSKRAYHAFEARLRLYRGEWMLAEIAANKALTINADLEDLNLATSKIPTDFESKEMIQAWERVGDSRVSRSTFIDPKFMAKYSKGDLRLTRFFQKSGRDYVSAKGTDTRYNSTFRNAELYLIKAESELQLGKKDQAIVSLSTLLKNRLIPETYETAVTKLSGLSNEDLKVEIIEERGRELTLEGLRWYDLKRSIRPAIEHHYQGQVSQLQKNDPRYVIRYPKEAISNNPDL